MGGNNSTNEKKNKFKELEKNDAIRIQDLKGMLKHLVKIIKETLKELSSENNLTAQEQLEQTTQIYEDWIQKITDPKLNYERKRETFATHSMNLAIDEITKLDVYLIGEVVKENRDLEIEEVKRFNGWAVCLDTNGWNCFVVYLSDGLLSTSVPGGGETPKPHLYAMFNCGTKFTRTEKQQQTGQRILEAEIRYSNNDRYVGKMLNFKPHTDADDQEAPTPKGRFSYKNGSEFIGHFKDGLMHSHPRTSQNDLCKLTLPSGPNTNHKSMTIHGVWANGVLKELVSEQFG